MAIIFACASGLRAADYALIVGVNACPQFRLSDGSQPRPLAGAEHDADAMAALLCDTYHFAGERVRVLKGDQANKAAIVEALGTFTQLGQAGDTFVFHFSGHGTQVSDRKPLDETDGLDESLCLYDADATGRGLLLDDELGRLLERLPMRRITVILDCCHAGTGVKDADDEIVSRYLPIGDPPLAGRSNPDGEVAWRELRGSKKSLGRQLTAFFACEPQQQAYERRMLEFSPPRRMGQFTHALTSGLTSGDADLDGDGTITAEEALAYVRSRLDTSFNAQRKSTKAQQVPGLEADVTGAALFGSR